MLCSEKEVQVLVKMDDLIQTWAWSPDQARQALLVLSSELRKFQPEDEDDEDDDHVDTDRAKLSAAKSYAASRAHMVSDLLTLYAHTETFFVPHRYGSQVNVRHHDVAVVDVPGTQKVMIGKSIHQKFMEKQFKKVFS